MGDWLLAVHSGAGHYGSSNEAAYLSLIRSALERAQQVITHSRCPPTASQLAVYLLQSFEHNSLTNAGRGSNLTEEGRVECEASVVCGRTHLVSCCGAVSGVKEPSALALKLLEQAEKTDGSDSSGIFAFGRQPPLVVAGEHARQLAQDFGLETANKDAEKSRKYQVTMKAQEHWDKWHRRFQEAIKTKTKEEEEEQLDTVGAVCMDPMGNVAAALSSGGVAYKVPGRIGLAGCPRMGCDAANAVVNVTHKRKRNRSEQRKVRNAFAVACTGRGEHFIRSNFVSALCRRLSKSTDLEREFRKVFVDSSRGNGGVGIEGGVLALVCTPLENKDGKTSRSVQLGAAFTTPCMGVGYLQCHANATSEVQVQLLRRPVTRQSPPGRGNKKLAIHFVGVGDIKQYNNEFKSFRFRGRASADILKTAGYKVSALDVERVLLAHPQVLECVVIGLPDETWGQIVAAIICSGIEATAYRKYFFVHEVPKNAMGKVNKKALAKAYSE
ncbi:unnamed protein product [Peronospora farinosa]|uniref:AMP-binding enzyme C-terminal domain-containing protein n=1 Tax=Peronospora farinosa TaxID=134698 RepID=A0AAV0UEY6_9STRA|nr:unnamed protein product [Peronospora farinosa]CAI5734340.1 unnamed protein product [Peronospora farinosa]